MFAHTERGSHQNTAEKPCVPFSMCTPINTCRCFMQNCVQRHTPTYTFIHSRFHKSWKTRRKPDQDCGSTGRKWNTPLDLNRKQQGKEGSDRTHTLRELELHGHELEQWLTSILEVPWQRQLRSSLAFRFIIPVGLSFKISKAKIISAKSEKLVDLVIEGEMRESFSKTWHLACFWAVHQQ